MKTTFKNLMISSAILSAVSPLSKSFADVPYYDTKDAMTYLYFEQGGNVMRAFCTPQKVIKSRLDCEIASARLVTPAANFSEYLRAGLKGAISHAKTLDPLTEDQVEILMKGASQDLKDSSSTVNALVQKETDLKDFIAKFGQNDATNDQLKKVESQLQDVYGKVGSYSAYQETMTDFETLAQQIYKMIQDPKQWSELIDSKNEDTLIGAFAVILKGTSALPQACDGDTHYGKIKKGTLVTVHQQRPVNGVDGMNSEMLGKVGTSDTVYAKRGVDAQGCTTIELREGSAHYRVRDLEVAPQQN